MQILHINDGDDRPFCKKRSKRMTANPAESNCDDCHTVCGTNRKWLDDKLQFARLICEIVATQDGLNIDTLCESMDLEPADVQELFDRADLVWEEAKRAVR